MSAFSLSYLTTGSLERLNRLLLMDA